MRILKKILFLSAVFLNGLSVISQTPSDSTFSADSTLYADTISHTIIPDTAINIVRSDSLRIISDSIVGYSGKSLYFYGDTDRLLPSFHKNRRESLRAKLPARSAAVVFSNPVRNRSNDVDYEYSQNPDFYYLTGIIEPDAVLLILKDDMNINGIISDEFLFMKDRDSVSEVWTGKTLGVTMAMEQFKIRAVLNSDEFAFAKIDFSEFEKIFYIPFPDDVRDDNSDRGDLFSLMRHFRLKLEQTIPLKEIFMKKVDSKMLREMLNSLREVKTAEEIILLTKAINITCSAHAELMKSLKPEMTEYYAEAIIEYIFKSKGSEHPGFPSIIGGGENSCILHYIKNRKTLKEGELLVVDIGAEYHGYTADITRTIPVNGKFSPEQKEIYQIVYDAQQAGISACIADNKFWAPGEAATRIIKQGLIKAGVITKGEEYRIYFMHGTSHYLGLDVHDLGLYGNLTKGNLITVEPGIYIPAGSPCDKKWWNIGVRIEDDVLITEKGPLVISDCIPKTIIEIEKIMEENTKLPGEK